MKWLFLLLFVPSYLSAAEYRVKIGVLDTGVTAEIAAKKYMCEDGQQNFTKTETMEDQLGHGSNVVSAIGENIDSSVYCVVSLKVFDIKGGISEIDSENRFPRAYRYIYKNDIRFVNMSFAGFQVAANELLYLKALIKNGVVFSVAAGNEKKNLDKLCDVFPACFKKALNSKNFQVVGATYVDAKSNYGSIVEYKELGVWKDYKGTSQAAPIHLANIISNR